MVMSIGRLAAHPLPEVCAEGQLMSQSGDRRRGLYGLFAGYVQSVQTVLTTGTPLDHKRALIYYKQGSPESRQNVLFRPFRTVRLRSLLLFAHDP